MACWVVIMCILLLLMIMLIIIPVGVLISAKSQPSPIHIFLSFRGTDIRETFASLLYDALIREGFNVFMDDQSIPSGDDIDLVIVDAIERSLGAAIIFSQDFASSEWCLDELVLILERKKMLGSTYVLQPIYVDGVQPFEVRNERGSYAKALAKHKKWYNPFWGSNKLKVWRDALTEVTGYKGRILKRKWSKFINEIVEEIRQDFCSRGITVNRRCCTYHSTRMDRMHAAHDSLKMLAIIGNLIFLLSKFLGSSLIKQVMETIHEKNMVVKKGLGISGASAILVLVLYIIILATRKVKPEKKGLIVPETKAPVIVRPEMMPRTTIVPETKAPEIVKPEMMPMLISSNTEESKEPVTTARTIKASVKKLFVVTMSKALSTILYNKTMARNLLINMRHLFDGDTIVAVYDV